MAGEEETKTHYGKYLNRILNMETENRGVKEYTLRRSMDKDIKGHTEKWRKKGRQTDRRTDGRRGEK